LYCQTWKTLIEASKMAKQSKINMQHARFGGGFATDGGVQTGGTYNDFSHNYYGHTPDEIRVLFSSLRMMAQDFPGIHRKEAMVHIENLDDLQQSETQQPERLRRHLAALLTLTTIIGGTVATSTDFANNVLELSQKLGVPIEKVMP
jgi:hypothetical protein